MVDHPDFLFRVAKSKFDGFATVGSSLSRSEGVSFFEPDIRRSLAQSISGGRDLGGSSIVPA
jgi:hypothetical protein